VIRLVVLVLINLGFSYSTKAYHHFIAMGYSSCMTCHFNPNGNGPLNDYGRALFATELSSRWIIPKSVSDDKLAKHSGFLAAAKLPFWIRPHAKYRNIQITQNPGSQASSQRNIPMQREFGSALIFDRDYKNIVVFSVTIHDTVGRYLTSNQSFNKPGSYLKELYGRFELREDQWLLAGFQDKPFGIRDVNHMFLSRRFTRNTQYDQSLGLMYFRSNEKYEFSAMGFTGNPYEDSKNQSGGISALYESNFTDQTRVGASFLTQKNDVTEIFALSAHTRMNLNYGAAFSFETGVVQNVTLEKNLSTQSIYWLLQNMLRMARGFNFLFEHELGRVDISQPGPWIQKTGVGLLAFPLPRTEIRFHVINEKNIDFQSGVFDAWQLQSQIHIAL